MPAGAKVQVVGVGKEYTGRRGTIVALDGVSVSIEPGEFVCVVGASGCGKSTLLRILAGMIEPNSGLVTMDDVPVDGPAPSRGVVFQAPNLFPWLTVEDNVAFGPRMLGVERAAYAGQVDELLETVGLQNARDRLPHELSGGMQQRAAIARALINDPPLLLMDEPFGALDALTRDQMQEELLAIWRRTGMTAVFVTHSVEEAVYLGTKVVLMTPAPGRIADVVDVSLPGLADLPGRQVRTHPEFVAMRETVDRHFFGAGLST